MFLHLSCAWSLLFDKLQALRVVFVAPNACEALNAAVGSSQVTRESHVSHKVAIGCCHESCPTSRTNRFCPICSAIQGTVPTVSTAPVVERASGFNMKSKSLKARPSSATMRNWDTVAKSARMTPHWRHPSHIVNTMCPAPLSKQCETARLFQRVLQTQKERSTMVNYKFSHFSLASCIFLLTCVDMLSH